MKTERELAIEQIELQERIQASGINVVTCGDCGDVMFHEITDNFYAKCLCGFDSNEPSDFPDFWYRGQENNYEVEETYLGQIESGISNLKVYITEYGYRLKFYSNGNEIAIIDCSDSDHICRELGARGYKKYFCKAVLTML